MWNKVARYINRHHLLSNEGLHLVALSGGADSVALLLILQRLGYHVEAMHCNFRLRGQASDEDEQFVRGLCEEKKVPLHLIHFDTREYASLHQVSIEMAARQLRYGYFMQLRTDLDAETICVAHHQDDANETLLMNLMRGAGIHGLTGIRPKNGPIVRPLLCLRRHEIEEYLSSTGQAYVTDATNLVPDVMRNRIRLQLLPLMEQIMPGTAENLARSALYLSEAEKVYDAYMEDHGDSGEGRDTMVLPFDKLQCSPSPLCLLHEWLSPLGFNRSQIEQIQELLVSGDRSAHSIGTTGRQFQSSTHTLIIDRTALIIESIDRQPVKPLQIPEPGTYRFDETTCFRFEHVEGMESVSKERYVATLDASDIRYPLTLRLVQPSDRFQPYGMKGSKLVSDYLTDRKMNLLEKRRQLVLTDSTGSVLWLVGQRTDGRYSVSPNTKSMLRVSRLHRP